MFFSFFFATFLAFLEIGLAFQAIGTTSITFNRFAVASDFGDVPCDGADAMLMSGGGTTYAWSGDNAFTSTMQNPTVSGLAAGTYNYTVTVTDVNTCESTATTSIIF